MDKYTFNHFITHFKLREIKAVGSNLININPNLIMCLDDLRHNLKIPVKITCSDQGVHAPESYHYPEHTLSGQCEAVDFKVLGRVSKNKILQEMLNVGFKGIGVYHGFWHGDIRAEYTFWKRKKGVYLPLL